MKIIKMVNGSDVLVDDELYEQLLLLGPWYNYGGYPGTRNAILMHNIVLPCSENFRPDHINGNTLDCRRLNLRIATASQNQFNRPAQKNNTTGYKGVAYHEKNNKYVAQIRLNGKLKYLGSFTDVKDAARAYNEAAIKLVGEFAYLNKI